MDVFISHAFEDKVFACALANSLANNGLRIWFDEFELKIGDSLRRKIDLGLSKSRYGIVLLSPNFFAKEWTKKELDALTARETKDEKVILPIWYQISAEEISGYSPMLADRFALSSDMGMDTIVGRLISEIKPISGSANVNKQPETELLEDTKRTQAELQEAKRMIRVKEIELQAILEQADQVAHTDSLTYLPNRRQIINNLQKEVHRSERYNMPLSVSMLDLDHLKEINDNNGHLVGDNVLVIIAQQFNDFVKAPNIIGRYGGDEFLIVLPNSTLKNASKLAEQLCHQIRSSSITIGEHKFRMTISIGIAQYKIGKENWRQLLDRADRALIVAKQNGRDRWAISE